jgi:hypothetical protein
MRAPFRVAVWGTGGIGGSCLRELLRLPEFDVVGAFAYDTAKCGRDVGELVGLPSAGVVVTGDRSALLDTAPECVLFAAKDVGDFSTDDDIAALLESGVNVVTPLPYRRLDLRADGAEERFVQAARAGLATFCVAGLNPDFFSERLTLTMSGLSNDITHIHLREYFRMDGSVGDEMLGMVGFGLPLDDPTAGQVLPLLARSYDVPSMTHIAELMGRPIERVEVTNKSIAAPCRLSYRGLDIAAGTIGMLGICFEGYVGDAPFVTFENFYYLTEAMRPDGARSDDCWTLVIEGRPSFRVTVEALASVESEIRPGEEQPTSPGYLATSVAMVQAIAPVVAAEPGIMDPPVPPVHWKADARA